MPIRAKSALSLMMLLQAVLPLTALNNFHNSRSFSPVPSKTSHSEQRLSLQEQLVLSDTSKFPWKPDNNCKQQAGVTCWEDGPCADAVIQPVDIDDADPLLMLWPADQGQCELLVIRSHDLDMSQGVHCATMFIRSNRCFRTWPR